MRKYLVQDIETIPETELADQWAPQRDKLIAAGTPDPFPPIQMHKVVAIGMLALDKYFMPIMSGCAGGGASGGKSEKEMITAWSSVVQNGEHQPLRLVDWNGRAFDMPVLQTRAFRHGVPLKWYFGLQPDSRGGISQWSKEYRDRYGGAHEDLAEAWTGHGAFVKPSMAHLARLMGLPGKIGIDGSKVYDQYKAGDLASIDIYCMQDVFQTAFLFQRFQYISGRIDLDAYQRAAQALLDFVKEKSPDLHEKIDARAVLLDSV